MRDPIFRFDIEQNTPEWDEIRLGKITGSKAGLLLGTGKDGGLTVAAKDYARRKAAEWITGQNPYNGFANQYTDRGHDMETLAAYEYEDQTFNQCQKVGFVERSAYAGTSPDRLIVGTKNGGEFKCFEQEQHLLIIDKGLDAVKTDILAQVQWNMFCCNSDWWHLVFYHPKFLDKKLIKFTIEPDPKMFAEFEAKEPLFEAEVKRLTGLLTAAKEAAQIEGK